MTIEIMDLDTYKWLLAKPHFKGELSDEEILHALVTCALELDSAARLSSSLKRAKPYHEAADLIVQAIRVLEAGSAPDKLTWFPVEELDGIAASYKWLSFSISSENGTYQLIVRDSVNQNRDTQIFDSIEAAKFRAEQCVRDF